jgi:transposase-like protein
MANRSVKLRTRRVFSEPFKKARVKEYETGALTVLEICKLYGVTDGAVYKWIYRYSTYNKKGYKVVEESNSSTKKVKELQARIKELEGVIGRKQIRIDYLEKMIEQVNEDFEIDVKKNTGTKRSPGSENTEGNSGIA